MSRLLIFFSLLVVFMACQSSSQQSNEVASDKTKNYQVLTAGPVKMAIDPEMGARIASFTYEGKEILKTSRDENNWQWGSTVWTSPQSDWNWPPPLFDTATYEFAQTSENRLHFYSPIDPVTNLQVIKSFRLAIDEARGPLATVRYQIYNRGTKAIEVAVWENTRVPFEGTTKFASGGQLRLDIEDLTVGVKEVDGVASIEFNENQPNKQKIFYDPPAPTKKYLFNMYENNGLLLLKSWKKPRSIAPKQSPLELYLAPNEDFAELEIQGAYKTINPKEYVDLVVFWQLMPIDELEKQLNLLL